MFPRGPRFEPLKVPEVPGPNAYNLSQDSNSQTYKRGAFLEKTDRFSQEKQTSAPTQITNNTDLKKPPPKQPHSVPSANLADRYAILQKKVHDLESVHNEHKKAHRSELERLKQDLARSQKLVHEQSERLDKQKKHSDAQELRLQELRKAAAADQSEIKDLRLKIRLAEHDKSQLSAKCAEMPDMKKALQAADSKRKQEVQEKDRKIAELEKSLTAESRKRQLLETSLHELKSSFDRQLDDARAEASSVQTSANVAEHNARQAKAQLESLHRATAEKEHSLSQQIDQFRALLATAAQEYARLSSLTVSRDTYNRLKREHNDAQFRIFRLERKLLNTEGQVVELAHLVRQTNEQNALLKAQMQDALVEITFISECYSENRIDASAAHSDPMYDMREELHAHHVRQLEADLFSARSSQELYQAHSDCVITTFSVLQEELCETQAISEQRSQDLASALASHEAIAARLEVAQRDSAHNYEQLCAATADVSERQSMIDVLEKKLADMQNQVNNEKLLQETALKKLKDAHQHVASALQKSRIAEDALRTEVDHLTAELAHAEQYAEAYLAISRDVQTLVSRNILAEDEAKKLSEANAELLGHHNPGQKIMYVDRIRKELSEAKQTIVALTQEQEIISAQNADLLHELEMYKSVMVPSANKPRTNMTRIGRPPLVSLSRSMNSNQLDPSNFQAHCSNS